MGIVGSEGMLGSGGKVTLGIVGMEGKLGSGGSVGLGRDGWVVGKVGNVGCGRVGIVVGKGGIMGFGKFGSEGNVGNCRRWRAARPTSIIENDKTMKKARMKHLKEAIITWMLLYFKIIGSGENNFVMVWIRKTRFRCWVYIAEDLYRWPHSR